MSYSHWLSAERINTIHTDLFHPARAPGERHERPISAVTANVENWFHYGDDDESDVLLVASVYAWSLARAHCFHDGNKRTAFATMLHYLDDCGLMLDLANDDTLVSIMVDVAANKATVYDLRDVLVLYARPS